MVPERGVTDGGLADRGEELPRHGVRDELVTRKERIARGRWLFGHAPPSAGPVTRASGLESVTAWGVRIDVKEVAARGAGRAPSA